MRSSLPRTLIRGGVVLALASLCIFLAPRVEAANGPFNGKIVFPSDRDGLLQIYVMNADGSGQTRLTFSQGDDQDPAWSPDGRKIAFDSFRDNSFPEIYVMNADGSGQIRLTNNFADDSYPSWSPDGTKIAFSSSRDGIHSQIYVMNADGSGQTRLTNSSTIDVEPAWSPDGTKIVFVRGFDIYVMNADGSNPILLTKNGDHPVFSPNGSKIAFANRVNPPHISLMNSDGTNQINLSPPSVTVDDEPSFSPDGTKITFRSFIGGNFEVLVMNADGSGRVRLTNNTASEGQPSWQPVFSPETIGVFRPSTGQWLLRNSNTAGPPDITLNFGQPGDRPVTGDWNGDGRTDIGVFRNGTFLLATLKTVFVRPCFSCLPEATTGIDPLPPFTFGRAGDLPVAGDWDGDGVDDVGIFRRDFSTGITTFFLRQPKTIFVDGRPLPIITTISFTFGQAGDLPIAGDWNRDGKTGVGVFRPSTGQFFLNDTNTSNVATAIFSFGAAGDSPIADDWDGDGIDGVGVFRPSTAQFFLDDSNTSNAASANFSFGQAGDMPVAGDWNGANSPPNSGVNDPNSGSSSAGQVQTFTTTCSDPDGWHDIHTIDFLVARHGVGEDEDRNSKNNDEDVERKMALWVQFDENRNVIRFFNPDLQTWSEGAPGSNIVLSSRFADLYLAGTSVHGSGPTGPSVQVTWKVVFKEAAKGKYHQFLRITDDAGLSTGFDRVGSWRVTR